MTKTFQWHSEAITACNLGCFYCFCSCPVAQNFYFYTLRHWIIYLLGIFIYFQNKCSIAINVLKVAVVYLSFLCHNFHSCTYSYTQELNHVISTYCCAISDLKVNTKVVLQATDVAKPCITKNEAVVMQTTCNFLMTSQLLSKVTSNIVHILHIHTHSQPVNWDYFSQLIGISSSTCV